MTVIEGHFLDGLSSKRIAARLAFSPQQPQLVTLHLDHQADTPTRIETQLKDLHINSRLGSTPREIALADNQLFITDDHQAIESWLKLAKSKQHSGWLHKLENSLPTICLATLATAVALWACFTFGIPAAANFIAFKLPEFAQKKLASSLVLLDKTIFQPSKLSPERQLALLELSQPILANYSELNPKIYFRSGMGANALALPNGEIVFTDALVNLVEDDKELLAVLFHELGHLQGRHIIRRVLQDSMVTLVVIIATGDIDTLDLLTGLPTLILDLSYSRDFETEADDFALHAMHQHGIHPQYFATVMQRFAQLDNNSKKQRAKDKPLRDILSTHPPTSERIQKAQQYAPTTAP